MEKEFVSYQQALELKELGFDEPCFGAFIGKELKIFSFSNDLKGYANDASLIIGAPTFSAVFRWFREKYDLQCWPEVTGSNRYSCRYDGNDETGKRWVGYLKDYNGQSVLYSKYEEAELACLIKLIEIVKEQKL
jgi:hypothetical protein